MNKVNSQMNGAVFYIPMDYGCNCIYTFTGTDVKPCLSYLKAFLKIFSSFTRYIKSLKPAKKLYAVRVRPYERGDH